MSANNEEDDLAKELDLFLDSYNKNEVKQDTVNEEQTQEFLAKFERIKVEVIIPAMEHIGKYLEKKGHSYSIKDEASIYIDNPSIKMEIYPRTSSDAPIQEHEFPVIAFIAEQDIKTVGIEVRDGMPGRPGLMRGHITDLDSLTREYVRTQIVALIKINFAKRAYQTNR